MSAPGRPRPLALTLGEPAGIGPDIAIDAWLARTRAEVPAFLFLGSAELLLRRAEEMHRTVAVEQVAAGDAAEAFRDALPCLEGAPYVSAAPRALDRAGAEAAIASIRGAVALVRAGEASAVVTNPIHKKALQDVGFPFPGHTEFLGALAAELFGVEATPVMLLAGPDLRVVPVTVHIPLAAVPGVLTMKLIVRTGVLVARELAARFGIASPRLAVAGLNPHAGEGGMLGDEDERIVRPAVEALRAGGVDAVGPLAADTLFHADARLTYDVALCMYHDQALIPLKTLAFDEGVNVTLGLPFVRTSPDHGTALPLAGTGRARPASLIAALRMAAALTRGDAA